MAQSEGGAKNRRKIKNEHMVARLRALDDERTTCRCAQCYRIVTCESRKSRFTHRCRG